MNREDIEKAIRKFAEDGVRLPRSVENYKPNRLPKIGKVEFNINNYQIINNKPIYYIDLINLCNNNRSTIPLSMLTVRSIERGEYLLSEKTKKYYWSGKPLNPFLFDNNFLLPIESICEILNNKKFFGTTIDHYPVPIYDKLQLSNLDYKPLAPPYDLEDPMINEKVEKKNVYRIILD